MVFYVDFILKKQLSEVLVYSFEAYFTPVCSCLSNERLLCATGPQQIVPGRRVEYHPG